MMRKLGLALCLLLLGLAPAQPQPINQYVGVGVYPFQAKGYCQLTSLSSAVSVSTCSGGIPTGSDLMVICAETQGIRYRDDGVAPTSSVGMPIAAGSCFQYSGSSLSAVQVIEQTASAKLNILFYK